MALMTAVAGAVAVVSLCQPNDRDQRQFGPIESELYIEVLAITSAIAGRQKPTCKGSGRGHVIVVQCEVQQLASEEIYKAALLQGWVDRKVERGFKVDERTRFLKRNGEQLDIFDGSATGTNVVISRDLRQL
jgi:hypothetical protein